MVKPNWDIFRSKFSENPQRYFEWFCYLLFCIEHNKPLGIFRYKNQIAIETDPIKVNEEIIGWQAKFYDTPLSKKVGEIIDDLEKLKKYYPDVTKIVFYTNQEWQQSKKGKPKGLIKIEQKAKELNIKLEWRCSSFFESPFVCIENEIIAKHFFTNDKSIFDLTQELQNHTENIFKQIKTYISFKDKKIEIDRSGILNEIKNSKDQVIILSGIAGVGKTALIKKYYEEIKDLIPFYVFKATEFGNLRSLSEFFKDFNFNEFISAHGKDAEKIIVIDSAEKILDIQNKDPLREFLQAIIDNEWKIIFTTRENYIDVLYAEFSEIYGIIPKDVNLQNLTLEELEELSDKFKFNLPFNRKLLELIRNPFYLNEYLKSYDENKKLDYTSFKEKLWKQITLKPKSEQCFLNIAFNRAKSGKFFITPTCDPLILEELINIGILGYESPYGYFITHDIYEELALEKIIEREFLSKHSINGFFQNIGSSLPIRRCFRNWLSVKLLLNDINIKQFVEDALSSDIEQFWKDEILISILLSDYSETFFELFKDELLKNEQKLLKRIIFLLRIACKEIDYEFFDQIGFKKSNLHILAGLLTKPKGRGWESLIKFIYNNIEKLGIKSINFVLPAIYDWNSKFNKGEATRFASLIALKYYQYQLNVKEDEYLDYYDETKSKLLQTILSGASEIKEELKEIFDEILKNNWKYHKDPYYDLVKLIITPNPENKFSGLFVAQILPSYVLKLADLFWSYTPNTADDKKTNIYAFLEDELYREDIGYYFGLERSYGSYSPPSAYQTPIYWLLKDSPRETIDFILKFVNKSVTHYAEFKFSDSVKKVKIYFDDGTIKEQYVNDYLWDMYRGTRNSPYLLQSIHMALEKYLLEIAKDLKSEELEQLLIYLLKNSESASITAVVASIVLAYPDKTFNVAKILFKTKEFIIHDKDRLSSEDETRILYSIGYGLNNLNKLYYDERIKTCNDMHRKRCLENLFLYYQLFRGENVSEEEAQNRQKELWNILDNYYKQLPDKDKESKEDKAWRLFLARMDIRKMEKIKVKEISDGILIEFYPKLRPDLKKHSEKSLKESLKYLKHTSLKYWAFYKMRGDERYKEFKKYEENPKQALREVKELSKKIMAKDSDEFYFLNHSVLAEACSTLIKFHINDLTKEEKEFCKDIVLEFASKPLRSGYQYRTGNGVGPAILVLPILFKEFPKEREKIKTILLSLLLVQYLISSGREIADIASYAVEELFKISFDDAQSLLFGYLKLKPKYETFRRENGLLLGESELINEFIKRYKTDLEKVVNNEVMHYDLGTIENLNLSILNRAFQLIPENTNDLVHKDLIKRIIKVFVSKTLINKKEARIDYKVKKGFLQKFANFILNLPENELNDYLRPFVENFNASEIIADLFQELIIAEDILKTYNKFWIIWENFKGKVFEICKDEKNLYAKEIIKSFLFATVPWKEDAKEWHALKDNNKKFFKEVSQRIGHCPSVLYAIAKLLNGIGSLYLEDGIIWISDIIGRNRDLLKNRIDKETIYYIENLLRKYIYYNREKIRKISDLKHRILIILDFLVEEGSVPGYMLREDIL